MLTIEAGWTKSLAVARLHADPSGVQEASTTFQAILFPGLSTVTTRLRYISLFAAARYYRMKAGKMTEDRLSLYEYLRRFEALIAVSSVCHHLHNHAPDGIVGRGAGTRMSEQKEFELKTGVQIPPYNIYRGTLNNLDILDTSTMSDPLFEDAIPLTKAWDLGTAGVIGENMKKGFLPARITRDTVDKTAPAFCICSVPDGSAEQQALIQILFAMGEKLQLPSYFEDEETFVLHSQACRSLAWRFLLELVFYVENKPLGDHYTLVHLLNHDFVSPAQHPNLRIALLAWRWIAARTFLERGWTQIFARTIQVLKQQRAGLSRVDLRQKMQEDYLKEHQDEPIVQLVQEVEANCNSPEWLIARFDGKLKRDFLLCICIALTVALKDKQRFAASILEKLWGRDPITFSREYRRLAEGIRNNINASMQWAEIAEEGLVQHFQIALRKMSSGNPDSLLVDFDAGQWRIPEKALDIIPGAANGSTRLDVALGWAQQLGLVEPTGTDSFTLTEAGLQSRIDWDQEHMQ
jgi:hypothetical protein